MPCGSRRNDEAADGPRPSRSTLNSGLSMQAAERVFYAPKLAISARIGKPQQVRLKGRTKGFVLWA